MRKPLKPATPAVSRAINDLASVRKILKTLRARAQRNADIVRKYGSCENERYRALVVTMESVGRHSRAIGHSYKCVRLYDKRTLKKED